jgi:hypothetical protein
MKWLMKTELKGLLLFRGGKQTATYAYHDDWVDAFRSDPRLNLDVCDLAGQSLYDHAGPESWGIHSTVTWIKLLSRIKQYDLIIILHSATGVLLGLSADTIIYKFLRSALQLRKGKIIFFVGNEFKAMRPKIEFVRELQVEYVASQLPQDIADWLYADCEAKVISVPHALNECIFRPEIGLKDRQIDIGARSYDYPWFLGDRERYNIFQFFSNLKSNSLVLDISLDPGRRFDRTGWARFLNACKGTIGTEAGTSFLENDDRTRHAVEKFLRQHPSATFDEIHKKFFVEYVNPVSGKCISSRHFDAIGTKTCQIMFPGRFNDILVADEHYIALNRDFSNIQDVLGRFMDVNYRQRMVDRTYEYVLDCHTHKHRISMVMEYVSG